MRASWSRDYDSHHDHLCQVVYETDILEHLYRGTNCLGGFKRWWYDLFLLSYTDERTQLFYGSSHAVRKDRSRQFRLCRSTIHPLSKFRNVWDPMILGVILSNMAVFYHSTSIFYGDGKWSIYLIGVIFEFITIFDIYINSKTGYINYEARKIVLESKKIVFQYASTKLFAHVISSLPLQSILFLRYGKNISCTICKANFFVCCLELFGIFRLYRLFDASNYWTRRRKSFKVTYFFRFLRIAVLGLFTMLSIMNLLDTITLLNLLVTGHVDESSYYASIFKVKYTASLSTSNIMFVSLEFARMCNYFLLFSFFLKNKTGAFYFLDRITSLIAYLIATFFFLWSLVECYMYIGRNNFPRENINYTLDMTQNLVKLHHLPDSFAMKVKKYYDLNMTKLAVNEAENGLFRSLPNFLKKNIMWCSYTRLISRIPYFSEWPQTLIDEIVLLLQEEIYLQGDLVAEPSVQSDGLLIVNVGVLAVYSIDKKEKGHLIDGDYICELSLVTDKELRISTVIAITPCKILFLQKFDFRRLMRKYPQLFFNMKQVLTSKYEAEQPSTFYNAVLMQTLLSDTD